MKIKILTHGDSDGICAAALLKAAHPEAEVWITHPVGLLKDLTDTEEQKVYICDVAISEGDRGELFEAFEDIADLTYIDHHPLPIGVVAGDLPCSQILWDTETSASELTYELVKKELTEEMSRVALFGAISDYCDHTSFVKNMLDAYDKRTIYMEAGLLSQCLGDAKRDYPFKRGIVKQLAKGRLPSEIEGVAERAVKATRKEWRLYEYVKKNVRKTNGIALVEALPRGYSPTKAAKFAIGVTGLKLGLSCSEKEEFVEVSLRKKEDFHLDLNVLLRTLAPRYHGSGGGHRSAAGARIPKESFKAFIEALSKEGV